MPDRFAEFSSAPRLRLANLFEPALPVSPLWAASARLACIALAHACLLTRVPRCRRLAPLRAKARLIAERRFRDSGLGQLIQFHHLDGGPVQAIQGDHEIDAVARGTNNDGITRRTGGGPRTALQRDRMCAGAPPSDAITQDACPRRRPVQHSQWNRTERGRRWGHLTSDLSRR